MTTPPRMFAKHNIAGRDLGRIVDTLIDRMGVTLRPYQRGELRTYLINKLWWEWPSETLNSVQLELEERA